MSHIVKPWYLRLVISLYTTSANYTVIVLQSGQIERSIILRVRDDSEPELMEYFTVELANPTGGALLADTAVSEQIVDQVLMYLL